MLIGGARSPVAPLSAGPDYTRGIMSKRVTSGEAHIRGSAPVQQRNVAAVASRWLIYH